MTDHTASDAEPTDLPTALIELRHAREEIDRLRPFVDMVDQAQRDAEPAAGVAPAADETQRRDRYAAPLFAIMRENGWDGEGTERVVSEMDLVLNAVMAVADAEQHVRNTQTVARERESYRKAWKEEQRRRAGAEAAVKRVREFAEYTRDKTATGRNDHGIGQYETAVQLLALLTAAHPDEPEPPAAVQRLRRMADETPTTEHVCKPGASTYYCPTSGQTESDCHGGFNVCCDQPDLHQPAAGARQDGATP